MKRFILTLGSWQIIMVTAALRQHQISRPSGDEDYLVLHGTNHSQEMRHTMQQLAGVLWDWKEIVWIDDLFPSIVTTHALPNIRERLIGRLEHLYPDEIWTCKPFDSDVKAIFEIFPESTIILYEDGLHSYVPQPYAGGLQPVPLGQPLTSIQQIARWFTYRGDYLATPGIYSRHVARFERAHLFLARRLSVPDYIRHATLVNINAELLLESIRLVQRHIDLSIISPPENGPDSGRVLVLGQCFARWNLMDWQEELTLYRAIILKLYEQGYSVLWKEHPRSAHPFFPSLAQSLSSEQLKKLDIPFTYPIELFINQLDIEACVSAMSTSLFYLSELFRIPAYSFTYKIQIPFWYTDFWRMLRLVDKHIPAYETLIASAPEPTQRAQSLVE